MAHFRQDEYAVVNVWTPEDHKVIPGANVGHVSIQYCLAGEPGYISLWPAARTEASQCPRLLRHFETRPRDFKASYEEDVMCETLCELDNFRAINSVDERRGDEAIFVYDTLMEEFKPYNPSMVGQRYQLLALKLVQANVRIALYGLRLDALVAQFDLLKENTEGWRMVGSNILSRTLTSDSPESCASMAFRCLKAGGMYEKLPRHFSSQTSSAVTPSDLMRHVVAAKINEKEAENKPVGYDTWMIPGVEETDVDQLVAQFAAQGRHASAAADKLPGKEAEACRIC